jgi:hypothetical protein
MIPKTVTLDKFPVTSIVLLPPTTLESCREMIVELTNDFSSLFNIRKGFSNIVVIDDWSEFTFETEYRIVPVVPMAMDTV